MSNPNPLVPQGSLLEEQARSKSTFQMAAFIVALHVVVLGGFLFLGCKKEDNVTPPPVVDTFAAPPAILSAPTNAYSTPDPFATPTNTVPPVVNLPPSTILTPAPNLPPVVESPFSITAPNTISTALATEYSVRKGDIAYELAKKNGISLKQMQEANPGRDLAKLRVGDKLMIPPPSAATSAAVSGSETDGTMYTVKGGDNLSRLARKYGTTVKAIREANGMTSNDIKVGQKLKIPGKTAASESSATPAPTSIPSPPIVFPANPVGNPQ